MERQLARKSAAKRKSHSSNKISNQPDSSNEGFSGSNRDAIVPDKSFLVTTARKIGSLLGRIVAKTEKSSMADLSPTKRSSPSQSRKSSVKRRGIATGAEKQSKVVSQRKLKGTGSARHATSKKPKPRSSAQTLAERKSRSGPE
jgi:hypothetical protein